MFYHGSHGNQNVPADRVEGVPGDRHGNRLIDERGIFKVVLRCARLVFGAARV